jgi:hypothetical protein
VTAEGVKILKVVEKGLKDGKKGGDVRFYFEEHLLGGVSLCFLTLRSCCHQLYASVFVLSLFRLLYCSNA